MKNSIIVKYSGNVIFGLPVREFCFTQTKAGKLFKYVWENIPSIMKEVLTPNQYSIQSKTPLTNKDLLYIISDIYEAYHEEKK